MEKSDVDKLIKSKIGDIISLAQYDDERERLSRWIRELIDLVKLRECEGKR